MPQTAKSKTIKSKPKKTQTIQKKQPVTKVSKQKKKITKAKTPSKKIKTKTNKTLVPQIEKLHFGTWVLTTGIIMGAYLFLAVIMEINYIETMLFSEKYYKLLVSIYPGITTCLKGAFVAFFYGFLSGGIFGGLFASLHNYIRKFFN